jgi:YidC/Oxa1 family membrane protein insertase
MPNIRPFLWAAFAFILFLNYEAWMHDYPPEGATPASATTAGAPGAQAPALGDTVPSAGNLPAASAATGPATAPLAAAQIPGAPGPAAPAEGGKDQSLQIKTDVLDLRVNLRGGEIDQADLLAYPLHKDTPNVPVRLLNKEGPSTLYVIQTGLLGAAGTEAPNHLATWASAETSYSLAAGAAELRVPLTWSDAQGLKITKTFVLKRGSYAIGLDYEIQNDGTAPRQLSSYSQILRHWDHASRSYFDVETYSFKGPAVWDGHKAIDLKVEDKEASKYQATITDGWLASMQHHFVSAIVPGRGEAFNYRLEVRGNDYLISATGAPISVAPGAKQTLDETLFVGPKLQSQLAATAPNLERTVDFGNLTVIAQPLFTTLNWVHGVIGNWGWSIILVTALIKLLFYPLSQASGRSMAKMRAVGPRMKQIQDTYKDDREKLGRAMMDLYKKEKINPLAGCLPMVVQIPFFISFYWVLLESVEMRQAPFLLWINDLSARDPYFILPLFMGGAMFAQFKLNPAPPDPMQAKVMQFMPIVMTGMMAWFPSGLVLYWITNTVLSILQQLRVNQVVEAEANKPRN